MGGGTVCFVMLIPLGSSSWMPTCPSSVAPETSSTMTGMSSSRVSTLGPPAAPCSLDSVMETSLLLKSFSGNALLVLVLMNGLIGVDENFGDLKRSDWFFLRKLRGSFFDRFVTTGEDTASPGGPGGPGRETARFCLNLLYELFNF